MNELISLLFLGSMLPFIILFVIVLYAVFHYRMRYLTVNDFSKDNINLPEVINKVPNEITSNYAFSLAKSNQFFLTNIRVIFFSQSILRGKYYTKYFPIDSVKNTEIVFKNPYGWLIVSGINFLSGFISAISSCSAKKSNSLFGDSAGSVGAAFILLLFTLMFSGLFGLLWYYLKGYYLIFDNNRITGLFCRSKEGLEDVLKNFDILKFNKIKYFSKDLKSDISSSKDIVCISCKSVITLDKDDLAFDTFTCPICSTINQNK